MKISCHYQGQCHEDVSVSCRQKSMFWRIYYNKFSIGFL